MPPGKNEIKRIIDLFIPVEKIESCFFYYTQYGADGQIARYLLISRASS